MIREAAGKEIGAPMELSFADLHALWGMIRFPSSSSTEPLAMIRADLVEATEYVTVVDSFVKTRVFRPSPGNVLMLLDDIVDRVDRLSPKLSESDAEVAEEVRAYAVFLSLLYAAFLGAGHP